MISSDFSSKKFDFSTIPEENQKEKLSAFLSLIYGQDLDPAYDGYVDVCLITSYFENTRRRERPVETYERTLPDGRKENAVRVVRDKKLLKTVSCGKASEAGDKFSALRFGRKNYYITKNRFKSPGTREKKELFGYSSIVIDIDAHGRDTVNGRLELPKKADELVEVLYDEIFLSELPEPNAVVFTGRGVQLWWKLEPITAKGHEKAYRETAGYFADVISAFLKNNPYFDDFNVDRGASVNPAGLVRLPGTYNVTSETYGIFRIMHEDALNLYDTASEIRKKKHNAVKKPKHTENAEIYAERREEQLSKLLRNRHECTPSSPELRDFYLFFIFNAWLTATGNTGKAFSRTLDFNKNFFNPMPEKEIRSYLSTSVRKGGYKCTNNKIIDCLMISENELELIGMCSSPHRKTKIRRPHADAEKVLKACRDGAYSLKNVAEEAGCSVSTAGRILRKNKMKTPKKKLHDKVRALAEHGTAAETIYRNCGGKLSLSGIYYIIGKVRKRRELIQKKLDEIKKKKEKQTASPTIPEYSQKPYGYIPSFCNPETVEIT